MTEATTLSPPEALKAREPLIAFETSRAPDMVPMEAKIEAQVDGFIAHLMSEDVHSDGFRARLDSARGLRCCFDQIARLPRALGLGVQAGPPRNIAQIYAARDDMARDAKSIEETKARSGWRWWRSKARSCSRSSWMRRSQPVSMPSSRPTPPGQ